MAQRNGRHSSFDDRAREFGRSHVRPPSGAPSSIQVRRNGREALARRLAQAGIGFERRDNGFSRIDDRPAAQARLDDLSDREWDPCLTAVARRVDPRPAPAAGLDRRGSYWTIRPSEHATDVMCRSDEDLKAVDPAPIDPALHQFGCRDVPRFRGRRLTARCEAEVTTGLLDRTDGVRIKHRVGEDSIKMADKRGCVPRIATPINDPRMVPVCREATRKGQAVRAGSPMRKGGAAIARRVGVSRAANPRSWAALAVVKRPAPAQRVRDPVSRRVVKEGRPDRALRPITAAAAAVEALLEGEPLVPGVRHKDLRPWLAAAAEKGPVQRRRSSGRIARHLRRPRAHGLIRKVSRTSADRVTSQGHQVMTTALRIRAPEVARIAA